MKKWFHSIKKRVNRGDRLIFEINWLTQTNFHH